MRFRQKSLQDHERSIDWESSDRFTSLLPSHTTGDQISVEPLAENNPLPFALKPLTGPVPDDAALEPVAYPLTKGGLVAASGVATIC